MRLATRFTTESVPTIAWEECACPSCGGKYTTPVVEAPDPVTGLRFLIVRCDACGLAFTNPRPDALSMHRFYPADYRCHQVRPSRARTDPLARFLPLKGPARLLDFGCGAGDFLVRMRAQGWTVVGLDVSQSAIAAVRARGLDAYIGTLPHADLANAKFEAITMRQSLEHTQQPLEVLRAAWRLLAPAGRLVVAVPNFDSLTSRWFGAHWYGLDVPRHLTHFTPATLSAMLKRAGFAEMEIHQEAHSSWIRHSARLLERSGGDKIWTRLLKSRIGSTVAARWGRMTGAADSVVAVAIKTD